MQTNLICFSNSVFRNVILQVNKIRSVCSHSVFNIQYNYRGCCTNDRNNTFLRVGVSVESEYRKQHILSQLISSGTSRPSAEPARHMRELKRQRNLQHSCIHCA